MSGCARCDRHEPDANGDCTQLCRHRETHAGVLCLQCVSIARRHLATIRLRHDDACRQGPMSEGTGVGYSAPGSRPPVSIDWLDWVHGADLLDALDAAVREYRQPRHRLPPRTVTDLTDWLDAHLERCIAPNEACVDTIDEWGELAAKASRLAGWGPDGSRVTCPGLAGPCGRKLRLRPDEERVRCPRCGTTWDRDRLLWRASQDVEVWVDAGVVFDRLGVPPRTLRRWAQQGKVRRDGGRFNWGDARNARHG